MKAIIALIVFFTSASVTVLAQFSHYSTQGFGAQSTFVSGAMIGSVSDNSAIFYNPAGIGNLRSSEISINANVYGISYSNIFNGLGDDKDLESVRAILYPQLLTGSIKLKSKKFNLVGAYMSRHYAKSRIPLFDTQVDDFITTLPGDEAYNINLDVEDFLHEQWAGLGLGYQHSEKLYLGMSAFIAYRNQKSQMLYSRSIVNLQNNSLEPISINLSQRTVIDVVSVLLKFGAQYHTGNWQFGANATLPKIQLFAFGNGRFEEIVSNVEQFSILRQDGVALEQSSTYHTKHKTPWSLALGASYEGEKTHWHFALEGFTGIQEYEIAKPKSPYTLINPLSKQIRYQSLLEKGSLLVAETSARPVLNVAIGCDKQIKEYMTIHYGFRTDFNYFNGQRGNIVEFDRELWDLYHFSVGLSTTKEKVTGTIGLDNAFGYKAGLPRFGNANIPEFDDDLRSSSSGSSTAFTYIGTLVVGVTKTF